MLSVKIALTGSVLLMFVLVLIKANPPDVPDWFKIVTVTIFLGSVIAFIGGIIATIWTN